MPKNHAGRCKFVTPVMMCLMQNHYPRHDLMTECTKNSHDIRYEIMTEGMKKKKVKKICGQSGPQMYLITEVMNS